MQTLSKAELYRILADIAIRFRKGRELRSLDIADIAAALKSYNIPAQDTALDPFVHAVTVDADRDSSCGVIITCYETAWERYEAFIIERSA